MNGYDQPIRSSADAWPLNKRLSDMEAFIARAANNGRLETTQGRHVAATYRVPIEAVKAAKAKYRNELCSGGGGK
jgi:hypothetical protein